MDALMTGLQNLLDPQVLIALLIGSLGGLMIGAVPGIGPAIAIAILLPATVFLPDLVSLVLLLGIYGSSMYGGAIPAILINTPGTPVNALTTYDGYSMTRRGEGPRGFGVGVQCFVLRRHVLHPDGAVCADPVRALSAGIWARCLAAGISLWRRCWGWCC